MHMLEPDSDVEDTSVQQTNNNSNSQQQASPSSTNKKTKVKIEIDDDEEDDEVEVPIKKKSSSKSEEQQQQQQQPKLSVPGSSKDQYYFKYISDRKPFPFLGGDRDLTENMKKWGLYESMSCLQFSYDMILDHAAEGDDENKRKGNIIINTKSESGGSKSASLPGQVHSALLPEFTVALLNSEEFKRHFKFGDGRGNGGNQNSVPVSYSSPVTSVKMKTLRAQETTLELFDRLLMPNKNNNNSNDDEENENKTNNKIHPRMEDLPHQIIRENGRLCMMPDVFLPCGITVSDQLRGVFMLTEDETECYDAFSEEERNEFLWHVMWRLVAGGAVNQYEDEFEPYKDATRDVYKSLISVGRSRDTGSLEVQSVVGLVTDVKTSDNTSLKKMFFPKDDRTGNHNFFYVIVDPIRKTCIVWYNAFFSPF